ncbi:MAG: hypothetical protein R2712_22225 [Vicinamibacterales bacterium]
MSSGPRGLVHATDDTPGITRERRGTGFVYRRPDGRRVTRDADLARIRALAIPPAWTQVWISPRPQTHLQATGRDARGRKQYRYHPEWTRVRDETKYFRLIAFAEALPALRRRTMRDLAVSGLPRQKVVAAVVQLLEKTLIRVGNDEYARDNGSFGLTTIRDRHARISGGEVRFRFRGKSGKSHDITLAHPRLARIVRRCRDLPGSRLFQYLDEHGDVREVTSSDVNAYLREAMGETFTAKDFRTWAGTVLTARALDELEPRLVTHGGREVVVLAIDAACRLLGNTRPVCRACYVHPDVIDAHVDGTLARMTRARGGRRRRDLASAEALVLALLRKRRAAARRAA